ncbi:VCBS repeat-containing protein [Blastococcus montanus]|uniref:FG-GAP repeat domain-containing protein n=1 Tax=Blastococcus montanus TaxID=3144973 RepID=UPI00320B2C14
MHPDFSGVQAWIAAVGGAVSLSDLRGLGRSADGCLVDPRDDSVTVFPVPEAGGPDYPRFQLRPTDLAYDTTMAPMGCVPGDFDEDGTTDLLVTYWGRSPIVFMNQGSGVAGPTADGFHAHELVDPPQIWNTTTANVGDVDGDGHLDILLGNFFPDGARVLDPTATDDGRMAMNSSLGKALNGGGAKLFLTKPTGGVQDMPEIIDATSALPTSSTSAWTLATGMQDLTGDLLPEVYLANDFGPDQLLVNDSTPGRAGFTAVYGSRDPYTPRSQVLGHDSFKGMGVTFTYADGGGLPSIMVGNITTEFGLHESNLFFVPSGEPEDLAAGRVPYRERSEALGIARAGWSWDVKAGDFDNSGVDEILQSTGFLKGVDNAWPELQELAMGNDQLVLDPDFWPTLGPDADLAGHQPNPFWVRDGEGRYADLASAVEIDEPWNSRGIALGDVDGDGRLDALVANQFEDSVLLLNQGPVNRPAAYLQLVSRGAAGGDRPAIGAQVELELPGGGKAQLYPANGHSGVSASDVHLALPPGPPVAARVSWRDATGLHSREVMLEPGRHQLVLDEDQSAEAP